MPYFLIKTFRTPTPSVSSTTSTITSNVRSRENQTASASSPVQEDEQQPIAVEVKEKIIPLQEEWKTITTTQGDTLAGLFKKNGISQQTLPLILQHNPHAKTLTILKPNQKLQLAIRNHMLETLIMPLNATEYLKVSRDGMRYLTEINKRKITAHNHYLTATINGSLYSTAKRMNIPYKLIQQMTTIFNWDINFSKDVRSGDQLTIMYKAYFIENKQVGTGEIMAVTYTNRGKVFQAIRYTNKQGDTDYYTPEGKSLRKAFNRYPVKFSHISSTFSLSRIHPVLHRKRAHKGIDLAAPLGTPIRAVGDGRIESIGYQNGYGNMIKIIHNQTYSSIYAHMLKFQKGLLKGSRIKQGDIIGFVGQSGLATGPHCHYELHFNQSPRNPATVDLPRASPIPAAEIKAFQANAHTLLAQMKLFEEAHLAALAPSTKKIIS